MISWLKAVWLAPTSNDQPPPAPATHDEIVNPDDAWKVLGNVNEWVKHGETKLGVVLAFLGVLAAGLITLVIEAGPPSTRMLWIEGSAGLCLLLAAGAATLGLLPQFAADRQESKANPLYYGDVQRYFSKRHDYADHLTATLGNNERVVGEISRQIVANSAVAVRKYTWANRALFVGFLAVLGTVAVVMGLVLCW